MDRERDASLYSKNQLGTGFFLLYRLSPSLSLSLSLSVSVCLCVCMSLISTSLSLSHTLSLTPTGFFDFLVTPMWDAWSLHFSPLFEEQMMFVRSNRGRWEFAAEEQKRETILENSGPSSFSLSQSHSPEQTPNSIQMRQLVPRGRATSDVPEEPERADYDNRPGALERSLSEEERLLELMTRLEAGNGDGHRHGVYEPHHACSEILEEEPQLSPSSPSPSPSRSRPLSPTSPRSDGDEKTKDSGHIYVCVSEEKVDGKTKEEVHTNNNTPQQTDSRRLSVDPIDMTSPLSSPDTFTPISSAGMAPTVRVRSTPLRASFTAENNNSPHTKSP